MAGPTVERRTGISSTSGKRKTMEDAHLADQFFFHTGSDTGSDTGGKKKKAIVTAIFDGHAGEKTALHAKNTFVSCLQARLEEYNKEALTDVGIWNALKIACVDVSRSSTCKSSGSTATIGLRIDNTLWVANVGDSRTILVTKEGKTVPLSEDALLDLPHYAKKSKIAVLM